VTDDERRLLERLAAEGKPTGLLSEDLQVAKSLESTGLIFMVRNTGCAIITPKGRRMLADLERAARKPAKPPLGFLD
jgi:hypothetical protein